jgi:tetratricopeptide (TPR) repeat protein
MNKRKFLSLTAVFLIVLLVVPALNAQGRRQQPPEYREIVAATRMADPATRLKEFERIKSAYPQSQMMADINNFILEARIDLAPNFESVIDLQKKAIAALQGPRQLTAYLDMSRQILEHPKVSSFDGKKIVKAILSYKEMAVKGSKNPELFKSAEVSQKKMILTYYVAGMNLPIARAYLKAGDAKNALASLKTFKAEGGSADVVYNYNLGEAYAALGQNQEAFDAYMNAAAEPTRRNEDEMAKDKAKDLYVVMKGSADGFEAEMEAKSKELPYHVEEYKGQSDWKGKAVLAELFTGSECPPCVGADLGFDGLLEAYPQKYLVILQYHLPIPRPDPMMNPATKMRQDYYGVRSTPTVIMEGTEKVVGGGNRGMAEGKYDQYKAVIDPLIGSEPGVGLEVKATIKGDVVSIDYTFDKVVSGADYFVVLAQDEQEYQGSNGLKHHKMVVRDMVAIDTSEAKKTKFDLASSEKATDTYMTEFAKTYTRIPNFKWQVRHNTIHRKGLKVVFFAQDKESKKILNATITNVK